MAKEIKLRTKKRKDEIILPGQTLIYQSNRVTNGRYPGFTLMHYKAFLALLFELQQPIKNNMRGINQLGLFNDEENKSILKVGIPLSALGSPNQYPEIIEAIKGLQKIAVHLKSPLGKEYISHTALVSRVEEPKAKTGKKLVYLIMFKDVAENLIMIDRNKLDQPSYYTKFFYEVGMAATTKYTVKLYWLISSFKDKGGFKREYQELRKDLGLEDHEYPRYYDFKKRVLIPAQKDLEKKADCWFNCGAADFEIKQGKKVIMFNFKIITPDVEAVDHAKADNIKQMLRMHAGFKDGHISQLWSIIEAVGGQMNELTQKVTELIMYIQENKGKIDHPQAYILSALRKEFVPDAGIEWIDEEAE